MILLYFKFHYYRNLKLWLIYDVLFTNMTKYLFSLDGLKLKYSSNFADLSKNKDWLKLPGYCCTKYRAIWLLLYKMWSDLAIAVQNIERFGYCCTKCGAIWLLLYKMWSDLAISVQNVERFGDFCTKCRAISV